jgi:hypothetical protein
VTLARGCSGEHNAAVVRRSVLVVCLLVGCSFDPVDLSDTTCPCAEGWWCDTSTDTCHEGEAPDASAAVDLGADAGVDLGADGGPDAGLLDGGNDGGPVDMFAPTDAPPTTTTVIPYGSDWEYYDQPTAPPSDWRDGAGDWPSGPGQLGFGDGDEATLLLDADPNVPSTYFRATIDVGSEPVAALMEVLYDDAVTVWVNDTLVTQENWTAPLTHDGYVTDSTPDNSTATVAVPPSAFQLGTNRISVMVKQHSETSTDLSFDLQLEITAP